MKEGWRPVVYLIRPQNFNDLAASYAGRVIDSAQVGNDGQFRFGPLSTSEEPALYLLCMQETSSRFANLLDNDNLARSNYAPVILTKGETVRIHAEAERFQASLAFEQPSAQNAALVRLRDIRLQAFEGLKAWETQAEGADDEHDVLGPEAALRQFQAPLMTFADTTSFLLPALLAICWVSPEGEYERIPEFLSAQCTKWNERFPAHLFVRQLCEKARPEYLPLMIGGVMPDFPLPMLTGDTLALSRLLGKRLTVVDLWASWCAACRRENREILRPLWAKYENKGLNIIGYSLDGNRQSWQAAILNDKTGWAQAAHLQGDVSPFMDQLRIRTIPANFLLDVNGRVVAKNLHGQDLTQFVENYLSH